MKDDPWDDRISAHGQEYGAADRCALSLLLSGQTDEVLVPEKLLLLLRGVQRGMDEDGTLVVGKERIPPPDSEQVFEAAQKCMVMMEHTASRLNLSHASRATAAKARRANANFIARATGEWEYHLFPARSTTTETALVAWPGKMSYSNT